MTGPLAKAAGVTYLSEGTHSFKLQNGTSFSVFASPFQPECGEWAFGYPRSEDHFGQAKIPGNVDIVMTRGPPAGCLGLIPTKGESAGCVSLFDAMQSSRPKLHCFGHIHEGYGYRYQAWEPPSPCRAAETMETTVAQIGAEEAESRLLRVGKETLMVNAAIMDGRNQPVNAPWLVELALSAPKTTP